MLISELVQKSGVPKETIHFYLREGLLRKPRKSGANAADYTSGHLERILLIKELRDSFFLPSPEIKKILKQTRKQSPSDQAASDFHNKYFRPLDRLLSTEIVGRDAFCEATGLGRKWLAAMETWGVITCREKSGKPVYSRDDLIIGRLMVDMDRRDCSGQAGYYLMDLSACIVEGTYPAALASENCALSAAEAVARGERLVFALCRPPGHHAGRDYAGGYCFINNASVAANWLSSQGRVAVLDIDYHCGNGTQDIFYDRSDVLTISIHADPNFEYPHFWGYTGETGTGPGLGFHRNLALAKGTDDVRYLSALEEALSLIRSFDPQFLVVPAGMDIYAADPLGTIKGHHAGDRVNRKKDCLTRTAHPRYNGGRLCQ